MRQILKMMLNIATYSWSYQIVFIMLGSLYGVSWSYGFMLTYWAQFIYLIITNYFSYTGIRYIAINNIDKNSIKALEIYKASELVNIIVMLVTFGFIGYNNKYIRALFSIPLEYRHTMNLAYWLLIIMGIIVVISNHLIFEGKTNKSLIISMIINMLILVLVYINYLIGLDVYSNIKILVLIETLVLSLIIYNRFKGLKAIKSNFKVLLNYRYTIVDIITDIQSVIIYIIALFKMEIGASISALVAMTITTLSVDLCWDCTGVLEDYYLLITNRGQDNLKRVLGNEFIKSSIILIMVIVTINLFVSTSLGENDINLIILEIISILIYQLVNLIACHIYLSGGIRYTNLMGFTKSALRIILTITIISPYSSEYSLFITGVYMLIYCIVLYRLLNLGKLKLDTIDDIGDTH